MNVKSVLKKKEKKHVWSLMGNLGFFPEILELGSRKKVIHNVFPSSKIFSLAHGEQHSVFKTKK